MLMLQLVQRHGAGEHHPIQWELVRTEVVVEEVHGEQEHHREERFFAMEDRRDVEDPTRQIGGDGVRNPHHQTADTDDGDTPERRSEEHTSELQSLMRTSYAVFCLKKKTQTTHHN